MPPPPASLSPDDAGRLDELARAAVRHQAEAAAKGMEETLNHVPRLLRGPVRKVLGV
ncbi:MAG: hypothetical protein AB7G37_16780 [Solirubrobacteraceae bacterium]